MKATGSSSTRVEESLSKRAVLDDGFRSALHVLAAAHHNQITLDPRGLHGVVGPGQVGRVRVAGRTHVADLVQALDRDAPLF